MQILEGNQIVPIGNIANMYACKREYVHIYDNKVTLFLYVPFPVSCKFSNNTKP